MPPLPTRSITVSLTGHRRSHPSYPKEDGRLREVLAGILELIERLGAKSGADAPPRLNTLLADGVDQMGAEIVTERGWQLAAPLPFGRYLNRAIAALPAAQSDIESILQTGDAEDEQVASRLSPLVAFEQHARLFQIAEQDVRIVDLLRQYLASPPDSEAVKSFSFETGRRFAMAGQILVEQCDVLIAVWDGHSHANVGGTGDTVAAALNAAVPVVWLDPAAPEQWQILTSIEMLTRPALDTSEHARERHLEGIIGASLGASPENDFADLAAEQWRERSSFSHHAYRRIETLFGRQGLQHRFASIRQTYETPETIAQGSAQPLLEALGNLDDQRSSMPELLHDRIISRFAWTDGISTYLSDRHRSSMIVNFLLGSIAIIAGVTYLPLGGPDYKWPFAALELLLLLVIVANTYRARRMRLHSRWFATRRAAEYLRHRPLMLALGVARPAGQWPHGEKSGWPEVYARHAAREVGLPEAIVDARFLGRMLAALKDLHVVPQRDYHQEKSRRLNRVHHALDQVSEWLFAIAIVSVASYLVLVLLQTAGLLHSLDLAKLGKWFTLAGVAFPTVGGALAGIRYFGDFERFADISHVTAQRLDQLVERIAILEASPASSLQYSEIADLVRAMDTIVMSELESWQAVFSGKKVAVPV